MITNFKIFEKVDRTFNIGDTVVWNYKDSIILGRKYGVAPFTRDVKFGDLCEVTEVKGEKGKLLVKLFNKDKKRYVNKFVDNGMRRATINPGGHWISARYFFVKPEDFEWDILGAIQVENIEIIKKLSKNKNIIDKISLYNDCTPLMLAARTDNLDIIRIIIDADADWNIKNSNGIEFLDILTYENKDILIKEYPDKYKQYIIKKESEKYNL